MEAEKVIPTAPQKPKIFRQYAYADLDKVRVELFPDNEMDVELDNSMDIE